MANKRPSEVRSTLAAAASERVTTQPEREQETEQGNAVRGKPDTVKTTLILTTAEVDDFDLLARRVRTAGKGAKRIARSDLIRAMLTFSLEDETMPIELAEIVKRQQQEQRQRRSV